MDERTLFQTLADDPEDEAARVVFADWLLERGDPMSEFISLQAEHRRKPLDTLRAQRAQDLLIMNWRRWVGPLHRVIHRRSCVFEGGFLRDVEATVPPSDVLAVRDAPQWSTVRALRIGGAPDRIGSLLESPWLRNLRLLRCEAAAALRLSTPAFTLDALELTGSEAVQVERLPAWERLSRLTLHEFDAPLAALQLTARELHVGAGGGDDMGLEVLHLALGGRRLRHQLQQLRGARGAGAR